jgi:hypothetical protein
MRNYHILRRRYRLRKPVVNNLPSRVDYFLLTALCISLRSSVV